MMVGSAIGVLAADDAVDGLVAVVLAAGGSDSRALGGDGSVEYQKSATPDMSTSAATAAADDEEASADGARAAEPAESCGRAVPSVMGEGGTAEDDEVEWWTSTGCGGGGDDDAEDAEEEGPAEETDTDQDNGAVSAADDGVSAIEGRAAVAAAE